MLSGKFDFVLALVTTGLLVGSCSHARDGMRRPAGMVDADDTVPSFESRMRRDTINCYTRPPARCADPAI